MPATMLWTDPDSGRVAHFAAAGQPAPARVTLVTPAGRLHYELSDLRQLSFPGVLPPEMLPQVCWMFRLRGEQLEFAPQMD